jgi:hypothetical protein
MDRARAARRGLALAGMAVAAGAVVITVLAQSASGWDLSLRNTSGGGGRSTGGGFVLEGSIGQPFTTKSTQGAFTLSSGIFDSGPTKFVRRLPGLANDGIAGN